jgi:hypothetical protein
MDLDSARERQEGTMSFSKSTITLNAWQKKAEEEIMRDVEAIAARKRGETTTHVFRPGAFIPGPPGTGKSVFIDHIVKRIKNEYPEIKVDVTASTGAAAARLNNAMTLACWLSIASEAMKLDKLDCILAAVKKMQSNRIKECDILIGDEMSMISQRQLENLNCVCQNVRNNSNEFGGIYPIFTGDPFQLPPIPHDGGLGIGRKLKEFVPSCLERQYPGYYYITPNQLMRAAEDPVLQNALMQLISNDPRQRENVVSILNQNTCPEELSVLEALELQRNDGSTILCTAKENELSVDDYNKRVIEELETVESVDITGPIQLHDSACPKIIASAQGSKNVRLEEDEIKSRNTWAPDNKLNFEMPYMIRANMKTPENVPVYNGMMCEVIAYDQIKETVQVYLYKLKRTVTLSRYEFRSEWITALGYSAFPLIRASAMTVHKAQGATLESVIFEHRRMYVSETHEYVPHMLYTAFSRVTRIEHIQMTSPLSPHVILSKSVQAKLDMIWKLPYMKDYLKPNPL